MNAQRSHPSRPWQILDGKEGTHIGAACRDWLSRAASWIGVAVDALGDARNCGRVAPSSPRSIRLRLTPTPRSRSAYSSVSPSVLKQLRSGIDRRTSRRRRAVSRRATRNGSTLKLYPPSAFSASWQLPKRTKHARFADKLHGHDVLHAKRSPPISASPCRPVRSRRCWRDAGPCYESTGNARRLDVA